MSTVNSTVLTAIEQFLKKSNEELIQCMAMKVVNGRKTEERYVALAKPCKLYTFTMSPRLKMVTGNHLLDLLEVRSTTLNELCFRLKNATLQGESDFPDDFLNAMVAETERVFPGMGRSLYTLSVTPADRIVAAAAADDGAGEDEQAPCGGFANVYAAFASYTGASARRDIMWHLENVSQKQGSKTLDLHEFDTLQAADLQALFMALRTNTYFTRLSLCESVCGGGGGRGEKGDKSESKGDRGAGQQQLLDALGELLRQNTALTALEVRGCVPKQAAGDFWPLVFGALAANSKSALTAVDVSDNVFDAAGVGALVRWVETMPYGLVELRAAGCGLERKALGALCAALKAHPKTRSTLTVLDLSGNRWDAEAVSALAGMFASPTMITELVLRETQAPLDSLLGALVRGCLELRCLDVSGGRVTQRGASQLAQWAKGSAQLKRLNVSGTDMPADALAELLAAIGQNAYLSDVTVKASRLPGCAACAAQIAAAAGRAPNIAALDLSFDALGEDGVAALCAELAARGPQCTLKRLNVSGNLSSATKERDQRRSNPKAVSAIKMLLNSEAPLEAFTLRGGRTPALQPSPTDCAEIIYTLAREEAKLLELDMAGCGMGNRGAVALGQMLQVNRHLRKLSWDSNGTTLSGFRGFAAGLERNRSLRVMALPFNDLTAMFAAAPGSPEATAVLHRIQAAIANNQNPQKPAAGVSFSSTGIITQDGRQDLVEREVAKLRRLGSQGDAARATYDDPETQTLLDDCARVQQMGASFQFAREEACGLLEQEPGARLQALSREAAAAVARAKSQLAGKMVEHIAQTFRTIDRDTANRLRTAIDFGTRTFDPASLEKVLAATAGAEIQRGAADCFNSAVDLAMDYVYDKLMDALRAITVSLEAAQIADGSAAAKLDTPFSGSFRRHDKKDDAPPKKEPKKEPKREAPAAAAAAAPPSTPPAANPPPVPLRKQVSRVGNNAALAAALAAGPVSPAARRQQRLAEEETAAAAAAAAAPPPVPPKPADRKGLSPAKPAPVKPAKTRKITYSVAQGESVLGVAAASNDEAAPALTHPTKGRARGPAGRKGGARRPPKHKDYKLTDPTAQLQPTML